jgi:hypothetical protein
MHRQQQPRQQYAWLQFCSTWSLHSPVDNLDGNQEVLWAMPVVRFLITAPDCGEEIFQLCDMNQRTG